MSAPDVRSLFDLHGKVAMVTGGCQNFGLEIATGLAEAGADLVVTSRKMDKAEKAAAEYRRTLGVKVLPVAMDLLSEGSIAGAFRAAVEEFGRIDVLVNNAGGHSPATGRLETETAESWNAYIQANLTGTFLCIRESARLMMPRKAGSIVNIASVTSLLGRDRSVYAGTEMKNPVAYTASSGATIHSEEVKT